MALSKAGLAGVFPLPCLHSYPLKMTDFYYACIVPRLVNKLYYFRLILPVIPYLIGFLSLCEYTEIVGLTNFWPHFVNRKKIDNGGV